MITRLNLEENTNVLIKTYINLGLAEFKIAFKDTGIEKHLWFQYSKTYGNNLLSFMNYLNIKERRMLTDYIFVMKNIW